MAKRKGKGKGKSKAKLTQNNVGAQQNDDPNPLNSKQSASFETCTTSLKRKATTLNSTETVNEPSSSAQSIPDGQLELRKGPSLKRKQSRNSAENAPDHVPLKRSRSSSAKPSTSSQEGGSAQKGSDIDSNDPPGKVALKRKDTLIIEPSTSTAPGRSSGFSTSTMRSSFERPSTSAQSFTTPKELIRIASLKKGLSKKEIVSILPAAASLSEQTLSSLTEPSTSDPDTKTLIAESMKLMCRASLRQSTAVPTAEPNAEGQTEPPAKKKKLSLPKKGSQSQEAKESRSVNEGEVEQPEVPPVAGVKGEDKIDKEVQIVCEVHPDCDPVYIREQLLLLADDPQCVSTVTIELFSATNVPTRADREVIRAREIKRRELLTMIFDMDTFFNRYPEPELFFETDRTRNRTKAYATHVHIFLKNRFPAMIVTYLNKVLRKCRNYLTPAYLQLMEEHDAWLDSGIGRTARNRQKYLITPRANRTAFPDDPNEEFYYERLYINHRQEILDQIVNGKKEREQRLEQARLEGKIRECEICCTEDIILDDMLSCQGGHLFCKVCVKMSANEQMGQGKSVISCLENDCLESFQFSGLECILPLQQSAILLSRMQTTEVEQAEIEELVSCPYCPYAVVISKEYPTTVLLCQRPGCRKTTCRICKDYNHLPMTCDEYKVEKSKRQKEFVENALSDAIIRECGRCHMRFFKEEGCNFMTCPCGAKMCYVCREMIDGYDHFRDSAECQQYVNIQIFHNAEVAEAYNNLGERFREEHPDMGDLEVPDIYRPPEAIPGAINQ